VCRRLLLTTPAAGEPLAPAGGPQRLAPLLRYFRFSLISIATTHRIASSTITAKIRWSSGESTKKTKKRTTRTSRRAERGDGQLHHAAHLTLPPGGAPRGGGAMLPGH